MPDTSARYRARFLSSQITFDRKYRPLFVQVANDIARLVRDPSAKFVRGYDFRMARGLNKRIGDVIVNFNNGLLTLTQRQIKYSWDLANEKTTQQIKDYLGAIKGLDIEEKYIIPNLPRIRDYMMGISKNLSSAVWQTSKQAQWELQTHLALGIMNGDSAQQIAQRIQKYLKNPDDLFRRVRKNGKLVASQRMKEYHPGQGVYRSAYKNALRIARTETNRAYLKADNERWRKNSLVVGIKISLSAQHPEYKFVEICEELAGNYPKEFVWTGWHPHCLCHATPILVEKEDFKAWLRGDQPKPSERLKDMPDNLKKYVRLNYDKFMGYKSPPYWMSDNKAIIDNIISQRPPLVTMLKRATSIKELNDVGRMMGIKMTHGITNVDSLKDVLSTIQEARYLYEFDIKEIGIASPSIIEEGGVGYIDKGKLLLVSKSFNAKDFTAEITKEAEPIWFAAPSRKGMVWHEIGHLITDSALEGDTPFKREAELLWDAIGQEDNAMREKLSVRQLMAFERDVEKYQHKFISGYAMVAGNEFIAEAFTSVINGDYPAPMAFQVYKLILKYFMKI